MKKLGRFALIGVIVVMLVASLGLTGCNKEGTENTKTPEKFYSIEQLTPEWVTIKAKSNRQGKYSKALAEGLKELGRNYKIISIIPIQEHHYREGSHANFSAPVQAFFVEVKPKY